MATTPPITPEQLGQNSEGSLMTEAETAAAEQPSGLGKATPWKGYSGRSIAVRLFLTCWVLYAFISRLTSTGSCT